MQLSIIFIQYDMIWSLVAIPKIKYIIICDGFKNLEPAAHLGPCNAGLRPTPPIANRAG